MTLHEEVLLHGVRHIWECFVFYCIMRGGFCYYEIFEMVTEISVGDVKLCSLVEVS